MYTSDSLVIIFNINLVLPDMVIWYFKLINVLLLCG